MLFRGCVLFCALFVVACGDDNQDMPDAGTPRCGDGVVNGNEARDDGNTETEPCGSTFNTANCQ